MYKSQDPITNTIEITRTIYPSARSPLAGFHSWDVDCQIRINGKEEYHTVTSFVLYQKTAPWMFEQWLLTGNELFEQGKRRILWMQFYAPYQVGLSKVHRKVCRSPYLTFQSYHIK